MNNIFHAMQYNNYSMSNYLFNTEDVILPDQFIGGYVDELTGGNVNDSDLTTQSIKNVNQRHANKSHAMLEALYDSIVSNLKRVSKSVDPSTDTAIKANLVKLKEAEDKLLIGLDQLTIQAKLGKDMVGDVATDPASDENKKKYKELFETVQRRQMRLVGALGSLYAYVPSFDVQIGFLPTMVPNNNKSILFFP